MVLTKMPMLPLGESLPPTTLKPSPFRPGPFSNATVCSVNSDDDDSDLHEDCRGCNDDGAVGCFLATDDPEEEVQLAQPLSEMYPLAEGNLCVLPATTSECMDLQSSASAIALLGPEREDRTGK
jgi:hypothetical protein